MGVRVCDRTRPGRGITKFRGGNALRKQLVEAEKGDNAGCGGRERCNWFGKVVEASDLQKQQAETIRSGTREGVGRARTRILRANGCERSFGRR